ncbi:hypothetical protein [Hahella ganghwensis]|uniref:hypothetical protein n=1 Tax=Hahella ganghwensis TaxID=286420 RepID=UPI000366A26D|nr:hypothetical protein [Hahella ganghwensis]
MEIIYKLPLISISLLMMSCASFQTPEQQVTDVYVEDFQSDDIDACRPSDVDLSHQEAEEFFSRSEKVEYEVIHDHYNVAPCYIEGVLKLDGQICDWKIQASAIGSIRCDDEVSDFVCDSCEDLFD